MNLFILAFILLSANSALAASTVGPATGDQAVYTLQSQDSSSSPRVSFQSKSDILSVDLANQSATIQQTISQAGIMLSQNSYIQNLNEVNDPAATDIQNCPNLADAQTTASVESIKVKAGTFSTCHLKSIAADSDGNFNDVYLGVVPFGILKTTSVNPLSGSNQSVELQSFHKN